MSIPNERVFALDNLFKGIVLLLQDDGLSTACSEIIVFNAAEVSFKGLLPSLIP